MYRNVTLVPTIAFGASGPTYTSEKSKGSGYYKSQNPLHTVVYSIITGFTGNIKLQGTLVANPTDSDWSDINSTLSEITNAPQSISINTNFKGQYIWIRAVISNFTSGSIEKISYSYN
jgi:hypothetical protein